MYFRAIRIFAIVSIGFACFVSPVRSNGVDGAAGVHSSTTLPSAKSGKVFMTMDQALKLAFPDCKVERTTVYLTEVQQKSIAKACKGVFKTRVAYPYVATKNGKVVGTAYFDTHKVRSLRETLMVVVTPKGKVKRTELLSFAEPRQYTPKAKWLAQFLGLALDDQLKLGKKVRSMSGATLTAQASVSCVRRILALHGELNKESTPEVEKPKTDPPKVDPPKVNRVLALEGARAGTPALHRDASFRAGWAVAQVASGRAIRNVVHWLSGSTRSWVVRVSAAGGSRPAPCAVAGKI